jgi:tol-pal system protein YbgF
VSSVSQEIEALRHAVASQTTTAATPSTVPGTEPAPAGGATGAPTTGQPAASNPNPIPVGVSPQKLYDSSFDDYAAGRYDIAVLGFQSYIQAYPRTALAGDAQFYIGQSLFSQSKWKDAQDAFQKVISDYPQSKMVPAAYYKVGQTYERLNQVDQARQAYDAVIKSYPDTSDAQLARQALERLKRE